MSWNLAVILREAARGRPDKVAVILDRSKLTYGQLEAVSNQVAGSLRQAGVQPGDRIGLMLPNVPQFPIAYYGILKAGAVVVPINVLLKAHEIAYFLRDSEAKVLIAWDDCAPEALKAAGQVGDEVGGLTVYSVLGPDPPSPLAGEVAPSSPTRGGRWPAGPEGAGRRGGPPEGARDFAQLMAGPTCFDTVQRSPDDTAVLLYTSGTTGLPKGAELTHFNLFMNAQSATRLIERTEDDVTMAVLPLFHSFGQSSAMNGTIYSVGTLTLVPRFDATRVLEVIQRDRVTLFLGVPTMYFALLHHPDAARYDTSSLRICVSGGASMPGEVMKSFEERFDVTILEGYGLSETSPTASSNRSRDERKHLSIGKPIWGVEMRIFDDQDRELPPGRDHPGEIVIRGHNVMKGYFRKPEATAEAMRGGWFHSGDIGYADEDGFVFIVDRKKELIIRGGFNVYPREVEEVLYEHPAVAAAAVIGVPDERLGEEVKAVVQLKPGQSASADDLIAYCKERVAAYKYPRSVEFVDQLPMGPTGKILKRQLKAELEAAGRP
jgi:long-chain acyl-CoA synthetase